MGQVKSMPELTQTFISLLENPEKYSKDTPEFQVLQRYMILQYAKTSSAKDLNEARLQLFSIGKKTLETLPPTVDSYYQHSRRALLQAAYIWDKALLKQLPIPDYSQYGWKWDKNINQWVPFWTEKSDASESCAFLIKCVCKKPCVGKCKCYKAVIRCSALCLCQRCCTNYNEDIA